jgi:dTDP-4-dehydrorhamnose reductase
MTHALRVLLTGAAGQVGRSLVATAPAGAQVIAATRSDLDIGNEAQVAEYVAAVRPDLIINAAGYTAVDKAEGDAAAAQRANVDGAHHLARAALALGATRMIHLSTDFVFDGRASSPYQTADLPAPLGVYGATKLAGEQIVMSTLAERAVVVRTAWVYAAQGQNFLRTMLRLMTERSEVRVVADQIGTPTAALSLARVLWPFAERPEVSGVFHWTDAGVASWYDFAVAIAEEASAKQLLRRAVTVQPIATEDYPTPAKRPAYSVLDKRATVRAVGATPSHWRVQLRAVIAELALA